MKATFTLWRQLTGLIAGVGLTMVILLGAHWVQASSAADVRSAVVADASVSAAAPLLHYQGRLLDPATGDPKPDGSYTMALRLYSVANGGSPLYTESKSVVVEKGLFSTLIGDVTPLDLTIFDGRALYLGITVGADPEATPRQRLAHGAYAIFANEAEHAINADNAINADTAVNAINATNAANAELLGGQDAAAFAAASHTHTGADLVDGSVGTDDLAADAVISAKIADGSVTSADIEDVARTLVFPARTLAFQASSGEIQDDYQGVRWLNNANAAYLTLPRPADWDGVSDIRVRLFFYAATTGSGNVVFFIRPRTYNPGETFLDTTGVNSNAVSVTSGEYDEMTITIPASRFGTKAWWYLVLQRNTSQSTYTGDVSIISIAIEYTATR